MKSSIAARPTKAPRVSIFYEGRLVMRTGLRVVRPNVMVLEPDRAGLIPHMVVGVQVDSDNDDDLDEAVELTRLPAVVVAVNEAGTELQLECSTHTARKVLGLPFGETHAK